MKVVADISTLFPNEDLQRIPIRFEVRAEQSMRRRRCSRSKGLITFDFLDPETSYTVLCHLPSGEEIVASIDVDPRISIAEPSVKDLYSDEKSDTIIVGQKSIPSNVAPHLMESPHKLPNYLQAYSRVMGDNWIATEVDRGTVALCAGDPRSQANYLYSLDSLKSVRDERLSNEEEVYQYEIRNQSGLLYLRTSTPGGNNQDTLLPSWNKIGCYLYERRTGGVPKTISVSKIDIHLQNPVADALVRYMRFSFTGEMRTIVESPIASLKRILGEDKRDPVFGAIVGYAHLRLYSDLVSLQEASEYFGGFSGFPDGFVIEGELCARRGEHAAAARCFQQMWKAGLPVFTEGLMLLIARLRQYQEQSQFLDASILDSVAPVYKGLQGLLPCIDFSRPLLTLNR